MIAIIIVGSMLVLLLIGVPIAFSMSLAAIIALLMNGISLMLVPQRIFNGLNSFSLMAVPLFVFVGEAMNTGGVTDRIFKFARAYVKHITGGLGHVNVISNMIIAGMSGSAVADAYGIGVIEIKAMVENGYGADFSAALTAASSTIGPIIPPSIPLVVYAVIAEQSVGRLFLGGLIPGILMGLSLMILVYFMSKKRGYKKETKATWSERGTVTLRAIPSLLTPLIMFSGIVFGIVTPTEGAALAAVYAIFLGLFIHKELKFKDIYNILLKTVKSSCTIMLIIGSANVLTWVVLEANIPTIVTAGLLAISKNKYVILLLINIILLILGCFLESISILMIMVPVLLPIVTLFHIDLIHLGVFVVLNVMIGLITPPVGFSLYVVTSIAKISFTKVAKAIVPFIVPLVVVLLLITYIPALVTWLPNLVMGH